MRLLLFSLANVFLTLVLVNVKPDETLYLNISIKEEFRFQERFYYAILILQNNETYLKLYTPLLHI